jgi:hypothetical protein
MAARLQSEQPRISRWPADRFERKLVRRGVTIVTVQPTARLPGPAASGGRSAR